MSALFRSRTFESHLLCCFLSVLMVMTPSLALRGQQASAAEGDRSYLLPTPCVVVVARPKQVLTAPMAEMLPTEVIQAISLKETGLDPLKAEYLAVTMDPPMAGLPTYSVVARFEEPMKLRTGTKATEHTVPGKLGDRPCLVSQHPLMPSYFFPDKTSIVAAPQVVLENFVAGRLDNATGLLHEKLNQAGNDDIYVAVDLQPLRPLIQMGLAEAASEVPPEAKPFLEVPSLVRTVELRLNFTGNGPTELVVEANNEADAERFLQLFDQAVELVKKEAAKDFARLKQSSDPVEQAMGRYQERMSSKWFEYLRPERDGKRLVVFHQEADGQQNAAVSAAVIGILVALLLPAVQAAREAARRNTSMNNMKNIMLALHNYADTHRTFPPHAIYSDDGKPLLSWRVAILPYIEQQALYSQFHLDEPWDSEHNRTLIAQMPELFRDPSSPLPVQGGKSSYAVPVGEDFIFNGTSRGMGFAAIRDGTSNTLMLLQVDDEIAPIWTKPDDWQYNEEKPLAGLGGLHPGIFLAGFADAHVRAIAKNIDAEVFKQLLTRAGGEVVNSF